MKSCTIAALPYEKLSISKNEYEPNAILFKQKLREIIWKLHCQGVDSFYCNCELGIPLWTAEIVCGLKKYNNISLNLCIPYEEQCREWAEDLRDRYYRIHENADDVQIVNQQFHEGCYDSADEVMADVSDVIIIFGEQSEYYYIADYAKANGIPVEYINPSAIV